MQGFLELVERDAYAIWWYNRVQRVGVDLEQIDDAYVRDLRIQLGQLTSEMRLQAASLTTDAVVAELRAIVERAPVPKA